MHASAREERPTSYDSSAELEGGIRLVKEEADEDAEMMV